MTDTLPTLEELQHRGSAIDTSRSLTVEEMQQAKTDKANKPDRNKTKRQSEALCRRQFKKFFGVKLVKVRDDLMSGPHGQYRVSKDVDFRGNILLQLDNTLQLRPLRVECKGITLKWKRHFLGGFALSRISEVQKQYLQENRMEGGMSLLYLSYHFEGKCDLAYIIPWGTWHEIEQELKKRSKGNYQGKSLRFHMDRDLIKTAKISKDHGVWSLCNNHWIEQYLPRKNAEQLRLLEI